VVSFLVVWEWGTPRFPIRHGVDGDTPARNPACALHLPDTWVPSSPTSPPSQPRCSTNDYVVCNAPACNLQRPGTPEGAGGVYLSRWRRRPGLSYLLVDGNAQLDHDGARMGIRIRPAPQLNRDRPGALYWGS
jgi:hypothetical protein